MAQSFRLPEGGLIERERPLNFRFNDRPYQGYAGDTLASALLANGVHLVGRSFKYHRPRGILAAGAEEPNAVVQVGEDPRTDPNIRATQLELIEGLIARAQNCWPTLEFDVGTVNNAFSRFLPAGFYYKTFMWPASFWMRYEEAIRHAAGMGKSPSERDPDRYDKTHAFCDVLVIGAGPAGLAAALAAGRSGARVFLVEQDQRLGGALAGLAAESVNGKPALEWVTDAEAELAGLEEVRVLTRTVAYGYFDHNYFALLERVTDHLESPPEALPRHRLWKLRAKQVVLASGAIERPLVFADNDRPGIMLAGACQTYVNRYGVRPGRRAVVFTNNDSGYGAALDMRAAGVEIAAVVDLREAPDGALTDRAEAAGINVLSSHAVIGTTGGKRVTGVKVAPLDSSASRIYGSGESLDCDLVAMSGGWSPTVHMLSQARGKLAWSDELGCFLPAEQPRGMACAGAANGRFGLAGCLVEGYAAGEKAAAGAGVRKRSRKKKPASENDEGFLPARWIWRVPSDKPLGQGGKLFHDFQNDVTAADLMLALREGYRSIEHVKRYTTTGMGTDQGKTGNVNAIGIVAQELGQTIPEVGVTTFRAPYTPVTFGAIAGRDLDDLLDPVRKTPMHGWHAANGAVFEDVGQWKRPFCYPRASETKQQAVNREVRACRESIGILDASTLGKIDIQGPDSAAFLNRVYTNAWSKLEVGKCRYGLMLGEDGMVMDDGVTSRLGEQHFLMTTTTGNAGPVLAHLEEWLQTEWPEMKVFLTSVTEHYATAAISGPNARRLMAELTTDIELSPEAFGHMTWRAGQVAGLPARVFRVSFTGEAGYEINVPARYGLALWQALMMAGRKYDITPFGTEAMHVLRAEKGYIIVGQETDGSVTPIDLGMDWIVSKKKDFIGKRSLARSDMRKSDRKQLVGLLTENPNERLPEGAQLVERVLSQPPMPMIGHVTSSYYSPNLERSIALALVKGGRARKDEVVYAPLEDGRTIACRIGDSLFYDLEGERLRA